MTRLLLILWLLVVISLTAAGPAVGIATEFRSDIEYGTADGESLKLDASIPEGEGPFPIVVFIHGGGWGAGDKARDGIPSTEALTTAGFTWFSINYRLAPKHLWPACIDDVRTALRWIKAHAAEFKGDPNRIALVGYSAGGHLAALAATTARDDARPQAMVLFAGPTDLVADCERRGGLSPSLQALLSRKLALDDEARAILHEMSPLTHVSDKTPPCLLIHGTVDESVPYSQSVIFQAKLQELGVPGELVTIPGGEHRMRDWKTLNPDHERKMVEWLNEVLSSDQ
jgi:alpha-L-fucosidase 2